jgi:hypothetical protein
VDLEFRFALPKLLSIWTHFGLFGQSKYYLGGGIKELSNLMKEPMVFKGGYYMFSKILATMVSILVLGIWIF